MYGSLPTECDTLTDAGQTPGENGAISGSAELIPGSELSKYTDSQHIRYHLD